MAWLAVDEDGSECVYSYKPSREWYNESELWMAHSDFVELPKGSIKKLIGRELTWDDEPVEI
jgi:hypothetical protein